MKDEGVSCGTASKEERMRAKRKCRKFMRLLGIDQHDGYFTAMLAAEPLFVADFLKALYKRRRPAVTASSTPSPPRSSPSSAASPTPSSDLLSIAMTDSGITDSDEDIVALVETVNEEWWLEVLENAESS